MLATVNRYDVQRMINQEDAQLVEVLPPEEYQEWHLPGAINIPLKDFDPKAFAQLDRQRPVILYCADIQ